MTVVPSFPCCPAHGRMKFRPGGGQPANGYTTGTWECPGWDGEGCPARAEPDGWSGWKVTVP